MSNYNPPASSSELYTPLLGGLYPINVITAGTPNQIIKPHGNGRGIKVHNHDQPNPTAGTNTKPNKNPHIFYNFYK